MIWEKTFTAATVAQTQALGRQLAGLLKAGDLLLLSGDLGAGKTTFTQGIGAGLQVAGTVSSPTFIIARVHPSLIGGPALIHVDAYRITGLDDLETLDLDSSLDESVTVIEWGEGKTEGLSEHRLEVQILRDSKANVDFSAEVVDLENLDAGERQIRVRAYGSRWEHQDQLLNEVVVCDF